MGKVFRIFKEGSNTYNDWNSSPDYPYDSTNRESIIDPEGAAASKEITSIPSPFARIDLVKNAFGYICRQNNNNSNFIDGDTIYHKLVSETLDVGEIFFNIAKFQNDIEIIKWNPKQGIKELLNSGNEGNMCLGDVLQKYLDSDSSAYNFASIHNIYLLNYKRGTQLLNIIGATSPATIFFSNANANSFVSERIVFGQHKPFGKDFEPLYKRDAEYIKAWFSFRKGIANFSELFPEVDDYLNQNFVEIKDSKLKDEILNIEVGTDAFENIKLSDGNSDIVEVLGYNILASKPRKVNGSDFEILSNRQVVEKPLVLPTEAGNIYEHLLYTSSNWGYLNAAPEKDNRVLEERTLPFDGTKQPYLTLGDFLEDYIIAVSHNFNNANYFDGNLTETNGSLSFLMPIKPLYFRYFTAEDLMGTMPDGEKAIEILYSNNEAKVVLRIPIRGNDKIRYIEYTKVYKNSNASLGNDKAGIIRQCDFTAFITPNIQFEREEEAYYTAAIITTDEKALTLDFYQKEKKLSEIRSASRTTSEDLTRAITYTIEQKRFEYIRVCNGNDIAGLIIPRFKNNNKVNAFEFAIDLGTSFTHIECKSGSSSESVPFGYNEQNSLVSEVFVPEYIENDGKITQWDLLDEQPFLEKDYMPILLGKDLRDRQNKMVDYGLPSQTVLSCARSLAWDKKVDAFALVNIPFTYGKRRELPHNSYIFNIKWGGEQERIVLDKYIECITLLLRNKVLMNNGDLEKTKIIWSYPQSMAQNQLTSLGRIWNEKYNKYFAPAPAKTRSVLESVAPIKYYFNKIASSSDIVNIDIGGGTTDIAFAKDKQLQCVTSFRFAMNDLFRDAIAKENFGNGIIDYYKPKIRKILENNNLAELLAMLDCESNKRPENMASFLFTLKDNQMAKKIDEKLIDFDYILEVDNRFKIVFLLFYTAIIYHVAEIIRCKNLDFPRHIAFSGNGGYVVNIISSNMKSVSQYTKVVLEVVTGKQCNHDIEIVGLEYGCSPKVVTCKGALVSDDFNGAANPREVILKADGTGFVEQGDNYYSIDNERFENTVASVNKFLDFVLNKIPQHVDIENLFGVTKESISFAKANCGNDLGTYLKKLLMQVENGDKDKKIEETLFFYPLKGVINSLSQKIYEQNR